VTQASHWHVTEQHLPFIEATKTLNSREAELPLPVSAPVGPG
jgi:hypothetical protein